MTTTIDIPGGQATLFGPGEMTERRRRLIRSASMAAAPVLMKLPADLLERQEQAVKAAAADPGSAEAKQAVEAAAAAIDKALKGLDLSMADGDKLGQMQDAAIVALLVSWTRPEPLPTMDTVQDLDWALYDALAEATKSSAAAVALADVDFSPNPDQGSPTSPSSDSDGRLRDAQAGLTPTSPTGGESTSTESYIPV